MKLHATNRSKLPQNFRTMKYNIGHYNRLAILEFFEHGAILDGGTDRILCPKKYVDAAWKVGDEVEVFVYLDQEDRLVATTEHPLAEVGDFAFLRVAWTNRYGAFLHWGLTKDLFVPHSEQQRPMVKDAAYLVRIYIDDKTNRIVATSKLDRYVQAQSDGLQPQDAVSVWIWKQTELGFKVIVNDKYSGLIYHNEIFQQIHIGDRLEAFVKNVRPDGRLDIALQKDGWQAVDDFSQQILSQLKDAGGFMPVGDHTSPEEIYATFRMSKKMFKKTIGNLFKKNLIVIGINGIQLTKNEKK